MVFPQDVAVCIRQVTMLFPQDDLARLCALTSHLLAEEQQCNLEKRLVNDCGMPNLIQVKCWDKSGLPQTRCLFTSLGYKSRKQLSDPNHIFKNALGTLDIDMHVTVKAWTEVTTKTFLLP